MEKEIKIYLFVFAILVALCACKKFVEPDVPQDRVMANRVFTDDVRATAAVTGIYGNMINGPASFANHLSTVTGGLSSDELKKLNPNLAESELVNNALTPSNNMITALWKSTYQSVYYANAVIEGLGSGNNISPAVKTSLVAEARFIRAFCYFYLVNYYGEVPLVLTSNYRVSAVLPRASVYEVYNQVINDLVFAKENLPASYAAEGKTRPTKWAAVALLARVYTYIKDWGKAEDQASELINSNVFSLEPLEAVFLESSKEAIWQLAPLNGPLKETNVFRPLGSPVSPQLYLTTTLLSSFEPGDERRVAWIDSLSYQSNTFYYPGKYKNKTTTLTEYYIVCRLAEIYLLRAEARANLGKYPEAVNDINTIRTRAGLAPLLFSIQLTQIDAAIEAERRSELFAEWGHRWFDLKRWNKATTILGPLKPSFTANDERYPIPADELIANPFLTQNNGY